MCGQTNPLISKMRELPVDIYELDFPVDLSKAKLTLGERTISGNVSTVTTLLNGTPEAVYEAVRQCHKTCGRFFIAGAGCELSPMTPPENLRAFVQAAKDARYN